MPYKVKYQAVITRSSGETIRLSWAERRFAERAAHLARTGGMTAHVNRVTLVNGAEYFTRLDAPSN